MVYGLEWLIGPPSNPSSSSATTPSVRPKSTDGGYIAPDRSSREQCYHSRDLFFVCLDEHDILDANKHDAEARANCPRQVEAYERDCARSWIKYFKEKRVMEYKRDATIAQIKKDDDEAVRKAKANRAGGKIGGWFS